MRRYSQGLVSSVENDCSSISGEEVSPKSCGRLEKSSESGWEPNWHWRVNVIVIGRENIIHVKSGNFNAGRNLEVIISCSLIYRQGN